MSLKVVVYKEAANKESRVVWEFVVYTSTEIAFWLSKRTVETRPSKRHKWQPLESWFLNRDYRTDHPDIPESVLAEAKQQIIDLIHFKPKCKVCEANFR